MPLRKTEIGDLDLCIDMYLDFVNALKHGDDDPWTENAVAERLKGILESPVYAGFVLEEGGKVLGFMLGVYTYSPVGAGYEALELFCASGQNIQATAARMLSDSIPLLKAEHVVQFSAFSSELWDSKFFSAHGFRENTDVKLFEQIL